METYRYKDEKSDKFWQIETLGSEFVVNYGKTGTIGKYQIKEFDSEEACQKEASKLINSKKKKGYALYSDFDSDNHFYLDDEEMGLHQLTSHPKFREHFNGELYYDCGEEEAPFGSDEGSDTLSQLQEDFRKTKSFDFLGFPKKLIEIYWDMTYIPASDISKESVEQVLKTDEMNLIQSDMVTYATAFAQIKITGKVDAELKTLALNAMKRLELISEISGWTTEPSEIRLKMLNDLEHYDS